MAETRLELGGDSLVDLLDRVLASGAVIDGTVLLTLAGVDLIRLDARLLLAAVDAVERPSDAQGLRSPTAAVDLNTRSTPWTGQPRHPTEVGRVQPAAGPGGQSGRTDEARSPDSVDLAGLVVALVDIIRELLERQALRRMIAGALHDEQVEHLGRALQAMEHQVQELVDVLGLRSPGPRAVA